MNVVLWTATLVLVSTLSAFGQEIDGNTPTPLSQLNAEAQANNPQVSAADHEARAARQMAAQVTTLPDPKFTYQQLSVGSPRPLAGYTNSDFAYIGIGASQELPYPGKLRLRGQVLDRDADTRQAEVAVIGTSIVDAVKADYLQLAYLQETLGILRQNQSVLNQLIQDATAHYQVGQGMQQDVLEAQVNRTRLVREITMHHQQMGQIQVHLKGLLNRDQQTPDIVTEDLTETALKATSQELLALVRKNNPQVQQFYVQATSDEEQLKEYRQGLVPQSTATYRAALSAYASNKDQFTHVLSYFTDLLNLKLEYAQTLLDHETALAHLESLTGATLR